MNAMCFGIRSISIFFLLLKQKRTRECFAYVRTMLTAAVVGLGCFPFAIWFVYHDPLLTFLGLLCGGLLVVKHKDNIKRILNGTESKFSLHRKKGADT